MFSIKAEASILSSLFGNTAKADTEETLSSVTNNSQNMDILDANPILSAINKDKNNSSIKADSSLYINNDALSPNISPLASLNENGEEQDFSYDDVSVYVVRNGDNIEDIAKMFDVSPNTIMWANDLKTKKLTVGDTLIILPVSGIRHVVKKGDTLKSIAKLYKIEASEIAFFNDLNENPKLAIDQEIIIPGAEIENHDNDEPVQKKKIKNNPNGTSVFAHTDDNKPSSGYFIKPIPCRLTQNKHDRYAVDMSCGKIGTPILAAASGKVILAKYGWNGAFGNLVIIEHPNGVKTFYAHQSKIEVNQGQNVSQGQVIGYVGNTGRSTGPHLHFEVRGAKNPGFDNSWAR